MAPFTFDYPTWVSLFPEFSACSSAQGSAWAARAGLIFDNSTCNPAFDSWNQGAGFAQLFYLLVSHIAWLNAPRDPLGMPATTGTPPPSVVGRINSASEGSVSVQAEWNGNGSPSQAWYLQTRYGAEFWAATAQYRTMRYRPNDRPVVNGLFPFRR